VTGVLEIANEFHLFRVDGDHRLVLGQGRLDRRVDESELTVAVGIVGAFLGLAIGLQTELLRLQQFADDRMADFVPELVQFGGQTTQALARPAQRRHRIAARVGLDKRVQIMA
jgi:hypothetical protein